jgi:hypothetical protein
MIISIFFALLPLLFYFIKFGTFNMIYQIGAANIDNFSLLRLQELFIDLNIGVFPYLPFLFIGTLFFLFLLLFKLFKNKKSISKDHIITILGLCLTIPLEAALSTFTLNWNHGTNGPSRYNIWIIPVFIFIFVEICLLYKSKFINILSSVITIFTVIITGCYAYLIISNNNFMKPIYHSPLATFVLNTYPHLYNPSPEIFIIRTGNINKNIDISQFNEVMVYKDKKGDCKKVYIPKS